MKLESRSKRNDCAFCCKPHFNTPEGRKRLKHKKSNAKHTKLLINQIKIGCLRSLKSEEKNDKK